jgi:hypothetical protein
LLAGVAGGGEGEAARQGIGHGDDGSWLKVSTHSLDFSYWVSLFFSRAGRGGAGGEGSGGGDGDALPGKGGDDEAVVVSGEEVGVLVAGEEVEGDVVIFGCLPPPTPNAKHPEARPNLRAYASALARDAWFERVILITILISVSFFYFLACVRERPCQGRVVWKGNLAQT